jgi:hypothetical protein
LHNQKSHSGPEDDFESVQDPIGFVALPAMEGVEVFSGDLVGDEDEGFGALRVGVSLEVWGLDDEVRWRFTIPRAMVFARVRGWFFMKRRGTERPIAAMTRMM